MKVDKRRLVEQYIAALLEVNKTINLTSITDYEDALLLHMEDSLAVLGEINASPAGLYGDIGSGCGIPGVPLAIMSERQTVLIDSVQKKMRAVQGIIDDLNLSNQIKTCAGRIEEYRGPLFAVLTARALSSLPSLLELSAPLLEDAGQLICLKARLEEEEKNQALSIENLVGLKLISEREYLLPASDIYRSVLVFEKFKDPEIRLPRKTGKAQKTPLSLK